MENSNQEKEFNKLLLDLLKGEEVRDKLITELKNTIDRIKPEELKPPLIDNLAQPMCKIEGFIYTLGERINNINNSNDRLSILVNRLNNLI